MSAMGGKLLFVRLGCTCMRYLFPFAIAAAASAAPVQGQTDLEKGFAGALKGCEEWVLNPASWAEGTGPFITAVGLGNKMGLVDAVEEVTLPPKELRRGNHYWRINSTQGAGYVLVVSDQLPMCHITGGGDTDLKPVVESVLSSQEFVSSWEQLKSSSKGEMASTVFRNRQDRALSIAISRAKLPGQRLDRVQVLATATYKTSK
jgi:hypothetical protein